MEEVKLEKYNINEAVWLTLWSSTIGVHVVGVKESLNGRYKYDLSAIGLNGINVRMYNVDHAHVSKVHPKHDTLHNTKAIEWWNGLKKSVQVCLMSDYVGSGTEEVNDGEIKMIHYEETKNSNKPQPITFTHEDMVKCWNESNITAANPLNGFKDAESFIQSLTLGKTI